MVFPTRKSEMSELTTRKSGSRTHHNFFCSIAAKLTEKLRKIPFNIQDILNFYKSKGITMNSFKLTAVTEEKVLKLLSSLNITKATGCDNISARFLKDFAHEIASPLTFIINMSLHSGVVPDDFKTARVVPLFKKGNSNFEGNYRPVSILPVVSKIFERLVYDQYYSYLCSNDLIYKYQSGFRKMFSTDHALTFLADNIRLNMDKGLYTGVILLDLQKAFDTVDHEILLTKLRATGADVNTVNWFRSYLCNRKQFVDVDNTFSDKESIKCGVPQGSILGPLLFTIYVNDMCNAVQCDLFLYADDSMLLVNGRNVKEIESLLELEMEKLCIWLESNKLSLHLGKTETILFGSKKKLKKTSKLNVTCNNVKLESKTCVKYLGAQIDQDMSGKTMGLYTIGKINNGLKFLYRKSNFLDYEQRKLLCNALLQPRFDYGCNAFYRGLEKSLKHKLQTAQNKIIRYILGYDSRHHLAVKDFKKVKYLDVNSRVDYLSLNVMYNVYNNTAPSYLCTFKKSSEVHSYSTRNSKLSYVIPDVKTQGKLSFKYNGAKLWNNLADHIKLVESKNDYKKKCKAFMFDEMSAAESDVFLFY